MARPSGAQHVPAVALHPQSIEPGGETGRTKARAAALEAKGVENKLRAGRGVQTESGQEQGRAGGGGKTIFLRAHHPGAGDRTTEGEAGGQVGLEPGDRQAEHDDITEVGAGAAGQKFLRGEVEAEGLADLDAEHGSGGGKREGEALDARLSGLHFKTKTQVGLDRPEGGRAGDTLERIERGRELAANGRPASARSMYKRGSR